jgi:hypothetical protein
VLGGIEPSRFYLFFGAGKEKVPDTLLYNLMAETVKVSTGHVVYILCGNYRRDRTSFDSEQFLNLLESSKLNIEDSLRRIHIIGVFSEAQLVNAPNLLNTIIKRVRDVRLVAVQQISKLFYNESAIGLVEREEFTGIISKFKELCSIHQISLVASCEAKKKRNLSPEPMGGNYLRHTANVILYLREMKDGDISAQLVKHFDNERIGKRVRLDGRSKKDLGRITKDSMRVRIQSSMKLLRGGFREALKDDHMQHAFDSLWKEWNQEQGAMIFSQVISALDLLNLTGILSNRKELASLRKRVEFLENRNED